MHHDPAAESLHAKRRKRSMCWPVVLRVLLWCSLVVVWPLQALSQPVVNPSAISGANPSFPVFDLSPASPGRVDVGARMGVLVDASGTLGVDAVRALQDPWRSINRRSPNFGFTPDAHWFRFQIVHAGSGVLHRFIEMPISFMDHVRLYHYVGTQLAQEYDTGDGLPFANRPINHQNFILPVNLQPGVNEIYVRLQSAGTIEAPLRIWEPAAFQEANQREKLAQGMVIGTLLVMVLYILFVYFGTRDVNYLYYISFVLSYLLFQYSLTGYTYAYLWPQWVWWNGVSIPLFIGTTEMTVALFCHSFLRIKGYSNWVHQVLRALIWGCGAVALLSMVLPYQIAIRIGSGLAVPIAAFCLGLGYWRWWRGDSFARLFCVAWSLALVGVMVLAAGKFGIVPSNFWTENAGQIGILGLVLLLSLTLVDRINHDRSERLRAQAAALEHERSARTAQEALVVATAEANRKLEQRVQERTLDLNATLGQLQDANAQLQRLSMTDGLTQISNRACFDVALAAEFKRAVRHKTYLSLLLIDVDHFKQVNDTWGHLAGDASLQALARLLQSRIHRVGDLLARYGGEEFVVMLSETKPDDARAMAESFRLAIEQLQVDFQGQTLRLTASVGLAITIPTVATEPLALLAAADKALYLAKQSGRNQVCVGRI